MGAVALAAEAIAQIGHTTIANLSDAPLDDACEPHVGLGGRVVGKSLPGPVAVVPRYARERGVDPAYELVEHHRGAREALDRAWVERLGRGLVDWGAVDMVVKALSWALRELVFRDPGAVRDFLDGHDVARRVRREVITKLETGRKR